MGGIGWQFRIVYPCRECGGDESHEGGFGFRDVWKRKNAIRHSRQSEEPFFTFFNRKYRKDSSLPRLRLE